ncbi:CoA transferase [Megasphaera sp.]|jgi:CoA:oxalate CoA-transferase|uniref:CaiB/BaiF CoA transferase family protein n=1 Tax=Megasphaera sp. TaxID=2023260 RepID=UPI0025C4E273|nr:CoA transferase [Megasphaera sp.]MCF0152905.1 CoA transferase [Megasphaera sp.]
MNALEDIKILDLSKTLVGNLATMYLKDFGAKVINLECPHIGNPIRKWDPMDSGESLFFSYINGGKQSLTLDISTEEGKSILKKIIKNFDVIVEDFGAGYMEKLGLDYDQLKKYNSQLIYAAYSVYGHSGPDKYKRGSSLTAQARSVALDMTGVLDSEPIKSGPSVAEHYAANNLAIGIVCSLIHRHFHASGQFVDIALTDSLFNCIEAAPAAYSTVGEIHTRKGNFDPSCAPYDTFKTNDGYVAVGVATDIQWFNFCDALNLDKLKNDTRFKTNPGRVDDYLHRLRPLVEQETMQFSKIEIEKKCREKGVPCSAVFNIAEVSEHEQTISNQFIVPMNLEGKSSIQIPNLPVNLNRTPANLNGKVSKLGEDTKAILLESGFKKSEIEMLYHDHII